MESEARRMWKSLKQRLGLNGLCCCGATWAPTHSTTPTRYTTRRRNKVVSAAADAAEGMNLAAALAAEREGGPGGVKTLMRLIEETDGVDWKMKKKGRRRSTAEEEGEGSDGVCCVCMERCKGAAFIPCGHAFCRVCSRELWANRGSCPVCNRSILQILDLF